LAAVSPGTITIFVSHRFSTVRMADLIVVLDGGRIQEIGNHTELLAAGGHYAELLRPACRRLFRSAVAAKSPFMPIRMLDGPVSRFSVAGTL